jgi:pyrroloquinoline quinone biosynthesis protein B
MNDGEWWLINASPDLPRQIENNAELQPRGDSARNSPLAGVLLTNADLDHTLGLLLMRQEQSPLLVYATAETVDALGWIDNPIQSLRTIEWRIIAMDPKSRLAARTSLLETVRVIALKQSVAFHLRDEKSGRSALIAPAVAEITGGLADSARNSDVVFFDGTFWSNGELGMVRPGARTARQMHHLPIVDGSLEFLSNCGAQRKGYIHINNTNPILMPDSEERRTVERAGIEIGYDGLEVVL